MNTITWKFTPNQQKRKPVLILTTIEETLAYLANPLPKSDWDSWAVCSIPLMDMMDEMEKSSFVYNADAIMAFSEKYNLGETDESACREGTELSKLVYNCQGYRRARRLEMEGWEVLTPELLEQAMKEKKRVQVAGHSALGSAVQEAFTVRIWKATGKPAVFRPKKQIPLKVGGMPCKLVA